MCATRWARDTLCCDVAIARLRLAGHDVSLARDEALAIQAEGRVLAEALRMGRSLGLARTESPENGDVVVIRTPEGREAMALAVEAGWVASIHAGRASFSRDCEVLAAWSVPWGLPCQN